MTTTQDARREHAGGTFTITFTRDETQNAVPLPMSSPEFCRKIDAFVAKKA